MSKEMTLIVLGILTAVLPFLGFPEAWRTVFFVLFGASVAGIGFLMRARTFTNSRNGTQTFMENNPHAASNDIQPGYARENEVGN